MKTLVAIGACVMTVGFLSLAGLSARGAATAQESMPADDARVAAGKRLFADTCQNDHCHGGSARSVDDLTGVTAEHVRKVIAEGLPDSGMQSFRGVYTPDQVDALVAYVLFASGSAAVPQPAHASDLRGDPAAGRAMFFDAKATQACLSCHTFQGRGGATGPDLTEAGRRPIRELFRAIVLRDGHASDRMPTDEYASHYSLKQLLDIVAFLKSTDPAAAGGVTLKDVF